MKPTRDDLRLEVPNINEPGPPIPVTDDDLEQMGLVKRPTCTHHARHDGCDYFAACIAGTLGCNKCGYIETPCPKCGGSGYGVLVGLDVEVRQIREGLEAYRRSDHLSAALVWVSLVAQVLAALDGEDDDV